MAFAPPLNAVENVVDLKGLTLSDSDDQIVVALDFGTTVGFSFGPVFHSLTYNLAKWQYSGIAFALSTEAKPELISILDWPGK